MIPSRPTLSDLQILARQAGVYLRMGFGQRHNVHHKGDRDVVTEIDHRSEDFNSGEHSTPISRSCHCH